MTTSRTVVSHDPLSPTPSTSSALKIPETADEGETQMEYSSDQLHSQSKVSIGTI